LINPGLADAALLTLMTSAFKLKLKQFDKYIWEFLTNIEFDANSNYVLFSYGFLSRGFVVLDF
jgi:hypothetical protein